INFENLLLRKFLLQFDGNQHFRQLAFDGPFPREKEAARKLHGQRGTALLMALAGEVDPRGLSKTRKINPVMLEESPVLNGQHRIDQNFRNIVELHHLPFRALISLGKRGDHLWLEFVGIELSSGISGYALDMAVVDANRRRFGTVIRARAGLDLNTASGDVISAYGRLAIFFPIASMSQRG